MARSDEPRLRSRGRKARGEVASAEPPAAAPPQVAPSRRSVGNDGAGKVGAADELAFWRKPLEQMTRDEWESLCDGCGRCCLLKLEDDDTGEIHLTRLSCRLLDNTTCRCRDYPDRHASVPDCVTIDAEKARRLSWLPQSCAYRRLAEGRDLEWWHPLVSGSPDTVHEAGMSVRGWSRSEDSVKPSAVHRHIIKDFGRS